MDDEFEEWEDKVRTVHEGGIYQVCAAKCALFQVTPKDEDQFRPGMPTKQAQMIPVPTLLCTLPSQTRVQVLEVGCDLQSAEVLVVGGYSTIEILQKNRDVALPQEALCTILKDNEGRLRGWVNLQDDNMALTIMPMPGVSPQFLPMTLHAGTRSDRNRVPYELFQTYRVQVTCALELLECELVASRSVSDF